MRLITTTEVTTPEKIAMAWCETCSKLRVSYQDTVITQAMIDLIHQKVDRHEQRFSKHAIHVKIYEKAPEEVIPI